MLDKIYDALVADEYIKELTLGRIKFYEYPATGEVDKPYIVIDPLDVPLPKDYADDTWMTDDYLIQIDVWTKDRKTRDKLALRIRHVMWNIGFHQGAGTDEWDKDFNIYRDARQYRGKAYRDDFDKL